MKRILAALACLVLLCAMVSPVFAAPYANSSSALTASKTELKRGDTFTVTATLTNTEEIGLCNVSLVYDAQALALTGGTCNVSGAMLGEVQVDFDAGLLLLSNSTVVSGDVFTFEFKVKEDAPFGTYNIDNITGIGDGSGVEIATTGATVSVVCDHDFSGDWVQDDAVNHKKPCNVSGCEEKQTEAHTFGEKVDNGANHKQTCAVATCGYVKTEAHTFDQTVVKDEYLAQGATCTSKAAYYKSCVCGAMGTKTFESGTTLPHTFTEQIEDDAHLVAGSGANCQQLKQYYYDCADCDAVSEDKTFNGTTYGNHQVSDQWTSENDTHFRKCTVSGCTYKEDEAACSGGTATCQAKATCTACGKAYGQLAQCRFTVENPIDERLARPATCIAPAKYYLSCEMCGEAGTETFSYGQPADHAFTQKIEDAAHKVAGSGADCQHAVQYYYDCLDCDAISEDKTFDSTTFGSHQVSNQWTTENEKHFHKCTVSGCTYKEDEASCAGGTATCTQKAECATCQEKYGTTLPHTFTEEIEDAAHKVAGSGADCQHAVQYYYDCADCDAISEDKTFDSTTYGSHQVSNQWTSENDTHFHKCTVSGCTYKEDEAACSGGTATCQAKATCTVCGKAYGQLAQCRFTVENPVDARLAQRATCTAQALYYKSCEMCGEAGTETFSYGPFADHAFTQKIEDAAHKVAGSGADCQHAVQYYYDCADCDEISATEAFNSNTFGSHQVSSQWTSENDTHFHKCTVSGCTYKEDEAPCAGGTATCTQKAECATCQEKYGTTLPHTFTEEIEDAAHKVAGSGADCQHAVQYYYDCADCDTISTTETFNSNTFGNHQVSSQWTSENDTHFHKCTVSGCTYKEDEAPCAGGTATCQVKATCTVCGNAYGQLAQCRFTVENPSEERKAQPATCIAQALYYKSCEMCGEAGTETFSYGPLADHVFGNWTAVEGGTTHKGTCTVEGCQEPTEEAHSFSDKLTAGDETHWYACKCGEKKDEVKHVFDEKKFEKDEKNHWHVCACGAKSEAEAHTWDEGKVTVETSTKHEGEKTFTCTACAATCVEKIPQLETPKNGDSTMVMPLVILAVLSALGAAATLLLKKRQAC